MKRVLLFFTIFCLAVISLGAQTITWTGAGDGTNWSNLNNWDLLVSPTEEHDVIIPDGSSLTINNRAFIRSITVQGNSIITLNDGISFTEPSSFEDNVIVNWHFGSFFGGVLSNGSYNCIGTLTNRGTININLQAATFFPPELSCVTLNNEGIINIINGGLAIVGGGILNNEVTGLISFQADETTISPFIDGIGTINNYGNIRKITGSGVSYLNVITNNMGKIEVLSGVIEFYSYSSFRAKLNNTIEGVIKGTASIDIHEPTNFTNIGSFEPGASAGTLTFIGDFTSAASSKLVVELNGLNQDTEYDLLAIQGNAVFNGILHITMGFEGSINDEFVVAATTGTITECNLAPVATSEYKENVYEFTVACRNNNEVVLTIANITLGADSDEFTDKNIQFFPNPVSNSLTLRNNSNQDLKSAEIIDINGRVVAYLDLKGMQRDKIFLLQNYATGIYFIKVNSDNHSIIKKIVKL